MTRHNCDGCGDGVRNSVPTKAGSAMLEIVAVIGLAVLALLAPGLGGPAAAALQQAEAPAAGIAPPAVDATAETGEVTYSYDGAGRLVKAHYGDMVISYSYDAAGNLIEMVQSPAGASGGDSVPTEVGSGGETGAAGPAPTP